MEKAIKGFERYTITEDGVITDTQTGEVVTAYNEKHGRKVVLLKDGFLFKKRQLQRLIAMTFLEKPGHGASRVIFIDGNPGNLHASNLAWATPSETFSHAKRIKAGL